MASITIRRLDEKTKARLRIRAAQHGRSMEEEARTLLRVALRDDIPPAGNLAEAIRGRILGFGTDAAPIYARIASDRRRRGRPISHFDAQIAAIARSTGAAVATRHLADFDGCGVTLVDPWKS